jgi:hypothetical protein
MNVDAILRALNDEQVDYLLIGGMNFLLRHEPELTFDVDVWVADEQENLGRLNRALMALGAAWGPTEATWAPVPEDSGWLRRQMVFCLTTEHGALDVFRDVRGLEGRYRECRKAAVPGRTASGIAFAGLSDADMLTCQEALPEPQRKVRRMATLRRVLRREPNA